MMVGLSAWIQVAAQSTVEWKCEAADACGFIHAITHHAKTITGISNEITPSIHVFEFDLQKRDGMVRRLVHSKMVEVSMPLATMPPPRIPIHVAPVTLPPTKMCTGGVRLECFEALFKKCALDWYIEEGDTLRITYGNNGSHAATIEMALLIGDASITNERRWWAADDGRLVRPLAPHERALEVGAQLGGLVIVEPYGERNA